MKIKEWRTRIDEVDKQLVRLLSVRAQLAIEIGRQKTEAGVEIYDAERERDVLEQALRENPGVLSEEALEQLFREIVRVSRQAAAEASCGTQKAIGPDVAEPAAGERA
jgi:chorismate mutase